MVRGTEYKSWKRSTQAHDSWLAGAGDLMLTVSAAQALGNTTNTHNNTHHPVACAHTTTSLRCGVHTHTHTHRRRAAVHTHTHTHTALALVFTHTHTVLAL